MKKKTITLIPDEILVEPESDSEYEESYEEGFFTSRENDVFSLIKETRFANFLSALGYFALLAICLVVGGVIFLLNIIGRFLGDSDRVTLNVVFQLVIRVFLRMLGCLFGTFYPPWGRMFLRFVEK